MKNLSVLLAVVGTTASVALAVPRETRTFAGPYNLPGGPVGNPTVNTSFTGVDGGAYVATKVVLTGTIDTIVTGTTPAQCSAFLVPPVGEPFQITLSGSFAAAPSSVNFRAQLQLPLDVTSIAGPWSIVLQDSTNNGAGADATVSNLAVIMDDGTIAADQTINPLPSGESTGTFTVGPAEVKWLKFVTTTSISLASNNYLDITTTFGGDTELGLYSDAGNRIANDDDGLPGALSILTFGSGESGPDLAPRNGNDGSLDAGTYWLAVGFFNMNFNAAGFDAVSTSGASGDIGFSLKSGTFTPPPPPTPPTNLAGTFGPFGAETATENVITKTAVVTDPAAVEWYKINTTIDALQASTVYFDIDTEGTALGATEAFGAFMDTYIGMYALTGRTIAINDDSGTGFRSLLSFGDNTNIRTAIDPVPPAGVAAPRNGFSGSLLTGEYYLAVATFLPTFGANFGAVGPTNRTGVGDRIVNVRTNMAAVSCTCCSLSNVSGPGQNTTAIDNELTADDIIVFLNRFFAGNALSNVSGPGQNTTLLDNELTADDIIVFLNRFFAGC